MERLFILLLLYFFIGMILGVIFEWKPKLLFFIWLFCVIYSIISFFSPLPPFSEFSTMEMEIIVLFSGSFIIFLGAKMGSGFYKNIFKKNNNDIIVKITLEDLDNE